MINFIANDFVPKYTNIVYDATRYWTVTVLYTSNNSLYNFEIRRDVTSGRLRTALRVTLNARFCRDSIYYASVSWYLA